MHRIAFALFPCFAAPAAKKWTVEEALSQDNVS